MMLIQKIYVNTSNKIILFDKYIQFIDQQESIIHSAITHNIKLDVRLIQVPATGTGKGQ